MTITGFLCIAAALVTQDAPKPIVLTTVVSPIEGRSTIAKVLAEGIKVQKGDVVAELDSSKFRELLSTREAAVNQAELALQTANKERTTAEQAVAEARTTVEESLKTAIGQLALERSDLERAKDRFVWSSRMSANGRVSPATHVADQFTLARASFAVSQAEKLVADDKNRPTNLSTTALEIQASRARERAFEQQARLATDQAQAEKFRRQILQCTLRAPTSGTIRVVHDDRITRPGATVVENQAILIIESP